MKKNQYILIYAFFSSSSIDSQCMNLSILITVIQGCHIDLTSKTLGFHNL